MQMELTTSKSCVKPPLYRKIYILQKRKITFLKKLHHDIMLHKIKKFPFCGLRKKLLLVNNV